MKTLPDLTLIDQAMAIAITQAERAFQKREVPVGAVILYRGSIFSKGHNFREKKQSPLSHAEVEAILKASIKLGSWRLKECWLITTLEPCMMCLAACQQARIEGVFFGAYDPKGGALSLGWNFHEDSRLNHRFPLIYHPESKAIDLLRNFFKKKRR